jgi:hypothetical protein
VQDAGGFQDAEACVRQRGRAPTASVRRADKVGNEAEGVGDGERQRIAQRDHGIRWVVERQHELAAVGQDTAQLDQGGIDVRPSGEVVERRVRDHQIERRGREGQAPHVGNRAPYRAPRAGVARDRDGVVDGDGRPATLVQVRQQSGAGGLVE